VRGWQLFLEAHSKEQVRDELMICRLFLVERKLRGVESDSVRTTSARVGLDKENIVQIGEVTRLECFV